MRRHPRGNSARARYIRKWLRDNSQFRRYVLSEIGRRGPLRSRELEDRAAVPWQTGGWNDGKSLGRMLDALWFGGKIAVVGRRGRERVWDLASRHPAYRQPSLPAPALASRIVESQLLGLGIAHLGELGVSKPARFMPKPLSTRLWPRRPSGRRLVSSPRGSLRDGIEAAPAATTRRADGSAASADSLVAATEIRGDRAKRRQIRIAIRNPKIGHHAGGRVHHQRENGAPRSACSRRDRHVLEHERPALGDQIGPAFARNAIAGRDRVGALARTRAVLDQRRPAIARRGSGTLGDLHDPALGQMRPVGPRPGSRQRGHSHDRGNHQASSHGDDHERARSRLAHAIHRHYACADTPSHKNSEPALRA